MIGSWSYHLDTRRVAWLVCDTPNSSTNVLSAEVLTDLSDALTQIAAARPVGLVLRSAKPNGFIAGADIKEFLKVTAPEQGYSLVRAGQSVLAQLAALACPTVAALHGFVLGGGLELALACTYRVGVDDTKLSLGLPEVMLGIHPGFGGTVRSVRLIGVRAALDLMLKGKPLKGARALEVGLLDRLVPQIDLLPSAEKLLRETPPRRSPPLVDRLLNLAPARPLLASRITASLEHKVAREHYPAPYAILDLWRRNGASGVAGYEAEAHSISTLMCTPTSRNLVRVFLLQDRLKGLGGSIRVDFNHVHVVGAGIMGGDIAALAALRGLTVTLQDRSEELVKPALERARVYFAKRLKDPQAAAEAMTRLRMDVTGEGLALADVVIEAIIENADVKRALLLELEPRMKPGAVLATNTSSIKIETLAEGLTDPERLVGMHFFNPVAQMQLVEIVAGSATDERVLQTAMAFTRRLDKLPLPCRSSPGFVVNRILMPYINEALFALAEGIPAEVIDRAGTRFGMPVGPIELADVVGLDVCLQVGRVLGEAFHRTAPGQLQALVEQKKLGRKTGQGFYIWRDGKPQREKPAAVAVPPDLEDRLLLPMLNEATATWRENVIADTDLLDAGVIFATGFAPFRGGPLAYAKERGITEVVQRLSEFESRHGERFRPDAGWQQLMA